MRDIKFRAWDNRKNVMRGVAVLNFFIKTGEVSGVNYWNNKPIEKESGIWVG